MASEQDANEKQVGKPTEPASPQKASAIPRKTRVAEQGKKIKKDLDKIMDEIDEVLEENAEEFIKSYVQRGGE
jgi:ubiquitin-like protein Pup